MEVNPNSKAAVSPAALCSFTHQMGSRLTQLSLANNTIAGLTQILNSVSENCPELQVNPIDFELNCRIPMKLFLGSGSVQSENGRHKFCPNSIRTTPRRLLQTQSLQDC
jgi:hypothetical protein